MNTTTNRKCHSSFVTFDLWLRCMNLANEIPFFWHVALTKGFSLDFKWDLDFGYFFLALSFLFFTYLIHCFQFWKVWNTELFVLKSASHERSAFFVCNRLHWLPKDDCIFAVGFPKKWPHFENPTVNTRTNRKCHSSFVTFDLWLRCMNLANEIPFFWHVALTKGFSLDFKWDLDFGSFFLALSFLFFTYLIHCFQFWKVWNTESVCTKICQSWKISIFCLQ